jgi:hypothetical protein
MNGWERANSPIIVMSDARDFAREIVQNVRDNTQAHDLDTLQLSVWIANSPEPRAVVDALPSCLQNDTYQIVDIVHHAVSDIPAFAHVNLFRQVNSLRANRG